MLGGAVAVVYVIVKFARADEESDEAGIFGMLIIVAGMVCVSGIVAIDTQWNTKKGIQI